MNEMETPMQAFSARAEQERAQAERTLTKAKVLAVLARRPHPHTELVGLVRAMVYGPFSGPGGPNTFNAMARQKAKVETMLRSMSAEGEIAETSTLATTTYHLPSESPNHV